MASEQFRPLRKLVESEMNRFLEKASLEEQWADWQWAFIAIIVSKEFDHDYSERARRNTKGKVLEFRLKLDHDLFLRSSGNERLSHYLSQLRRSVEIMAKWNMSPSDQLALLNALNDVEGVLLQRKM